MAITFDKWEFTVGPMLAACELCDFMAMEQDARSIVAYIGEVAARVVCLNCARELAGSLDTVPETVSSFAFVPTIEARFALADEGNDEPLQFTAKKRGRPPKARV